VIELFASAAWKVLVAGLLLGAGLPALFALGIRLSATGSGQTAVPVTRGRAAYSTLGLVCFAVVALAIALGITVVVASGFGKTVSFEHLVPTLVDKG
jgi:hypothetical protein